MRDTFCLRALTQFVLVVVFATTISSAAIAQTTTSSFIATTSVSTAICGNDLVDAGEECDVTGETGGYSTTIAGRQCDVDCSFGPYCGDGILQTIFDEECDDGNNSDGDFCSSICTIEPAGSGGGGSSGGGGGSSGGGDRDLGDTQVRITGQSFPGATINVLLDAENVGTVRAGNNGRFEYAVEARPGTVSMGFWNQDRSGTRSVTYNTTFDVTQGAITNVAGVIIPPTLRLSNTEVDPGAIVTISGQTVPNATVEVHFNNSTIVERTTTNANGEWSIAYNTSQLSPAEYTVRARTITGTGSLTSQSSFSTSVQLFLGVEGSASGPSDLNRDGSVNLIDFSILIFWWQTNGGDSNPPADINGNGRVSIEDFSILLFNWTG